MDRQHGELVPHFERRRTLGDGRVLVTGGELEECDSTGEYCEIFPRMAAEIFTP
jgi:hypothetical protein